MSITAQAGSLATYVYRPYHLQEETANFFKRSTDRQLAAFDDESDQRFRICAVDHGTDRRRASALLERRYAWRGYAVAPLSGRPKGRITLSASHEDAVVATLTAGVDAGDGLYVEQVYPDDVSRLRAEGRRLCEFTKLAVDENVRSQALLGGIFHVACMYVMDLHRCTDALIEVNPRHVRFYEQMLGFRRAADERLDPTVNAPAVLMRLDLAYCAGQIARLAGRRRSTRRERSFYPYFFDGDEAEAIMSRLRLH